MRILYPEGKTKALTFSYDDNQIHDRRLVEIFNRYGLYGTFHLNASKISINNSAEGFVTLEECEKLYKGHEISCHGLNHPFLGQLSKGKLLNELLEDKRQLEKIFKYPIRGMSYPFGEYSAAVITAAESVGMEYARTVGATRGFGWPRNFMEWHPTCHHNDLLRNKELVDGFINLPSYIDLPLFYIWGHSYEFADDNTWEEMELLCQQLSGREDVWYGTNIQVKDYICAVRGLVFSTDQTMIYNPSAITIYIEDNSILHSLLPGETLYLLNSHMAD